MELNNKVENFYNKHRSNIILASHTQRSLENILRDLFQEMYELGYADGRKPNDEDIKSCIAMCLTDANEQRFKDYGTNLKDCLAWLEKKGEKKPADKVKPKFKIGDYLVNDYCKGKVIAFTDDAYLLDTEQGIPFSYEHNAHLWTIQDAKDGDVLACENGWTCIFRCLNDNLFSSHCFMDSEGWFCEYGGQGHTLDKRICGEIHPATKKQRNLFFQKMNEAGYEWDAENKELKKIHDALEECEIEHIEHGKYYYCIKDYFAGGKKQASKGDVVQALRGLPIMTLGVNANEYFLPVNSIKQNHAWSEEDEYLLVETIQHLEELIRIDKAKHCACDVQYYQRDIDWLKSLKNCVQPQWKPSEEQIQALEYQVHSTYAGSWQYKASKELLEQLKKL